MYMYNNMLLNSFYDEKKGVDKSCREKQNIKFIFDNNSFSKNRVFFEIIWKKNVVETDRPNLTVKRMGIACRIPNATNTHSEYVILMQYIEGGGNESLWKRFIE